MAEEGVTKNDTINRFRVLRTQNLLVGRTIPVICPGGVWPVG